jgi:hypothetical protein
MAHHNTTLSGIGGYLAEMCPTARHELAERVHRQPPLTGFCPARRRL